MDKSKIYLGERRLEIAYNLSSYELLKRLEEALPLVGNIDFFALQNPERVPIERHFMGDRIGEVCSETMLAHSYLAFIDRVRREIKRPIVIIGV